MEYPTVGRFSNSGLAIGAGTGGWEDFDNDGLCNLYEYVAGTVPNQRDSRFEIKGISLAGSNASLSFDSVMGRSYCVQYSDDLSTTNWGTLTDNLPGTGGTLQSVIRTNRTLDSIVFRVSLP